jgi:hypothetical protein
MALPRPALLGILGVVLILVSFVATRQIGKGNDSAAQTPAPLHVSKPKPAPAKHAAAAPAKHAATPAKSGAGSTTVKKQSPVQAKTPAGQEAGASVGLPVSVAAAIAQHKVVVLFFGGQGTDDSLTAKSVRALKGSAGKGVAVFMAKLSNLADYRRVVEGLDVSQAPSIVVVDHGHKAKLLEGFIDAGSLRQVVADVAR